ncbi:MAG: hypothetical protein RL277_943 [Planctomycetota bacterium]
MRFTKHAMCNLLRAFIVFAGLFAGSCSNGGSESSTPAQDTFLHGGFALPGEQLRSLSGIEVRAVDSQGTVVATATTGPAGNFSLGRATWTDFVGRIEADATWPREGGEPHSLLLSRDVDTVSGPPASYLWLSPISTLASRYRANHPEVSIEASQAVALSHLGVPTGGKEPGFEPHTAFGESHRSPAAWSRLLAAVGASTLDQFLDALVLEMEAGDPPRSFRIPHPYPKLRGLLYGTTSTVAAADGSVLAEEPFFSWAAEGSRVVSDYRIMAFDQLFGFAVEKAGLGGPSTVELAEAIAEIQNELAALNLTLTQNQLSEAWGYTAGTIADPAVETIRMINNQYLKYMAVDPQNPAAAAVLLQTRQADLMYAVANLRDMLAGGPPAPFGPIGLIYARSKSLERFGVETNEEEDKAWNSMQFRDNQFLDDARVATDYYCGWMVLGANLLVEWSHLNSSSFPVPLAGNANLLPPKASLVQALIFGDATQPGINATIRKAQQLVPPAIIGSENVIVDCGWNNVGVVDPNDYSFGATRVELANIGTMFHKQVQYQLVASNCYGGPQSLSDGAFPSHSFRPATLAEYKRLRARAKAVNPGSPKQGLVALGFHVTLGSGDLQFGYYHDNAGYLGGDGWHVYNFDQDKDDGGVVSGRDSVNIIAVRATPGDRGSSGYAGYLEDAGTALVTGRITGLAEDTQSNPTATVSMSKRRFSSPDKLYPGSTSVADQVLLQITPNDTAQASFPVGDHLCWQTSDTTTVLPTNLPGSDLRSRIIWRRESLPATGYTTTGSLSQGLSASAGTLGCMANLVQSTPIVLDATFDPAVYSSLMVTPNGLVYDSLDFQQSPTVDCYATGYYVSQSTAADAEPAGVAMRDMTRSSATTGTVHWSASSPSGLAYFNPGSNVLHLSAGQGVETVTVTVTVTPSGGVPIQASGTIQVSFD